MSWRSVSICPSKSRRQLSMAQTEAGSVVVTVSEIDGCNSCSVQLNPDELSELVVALTEIAKETGQR